MATYKVRGTAHNIIYPYRTESGQVSLKPCKGPKSYGKLPGQIPTLSSSSVKKVYTVLTSGFETALKWHYIAAIPVTSAPAEKTAKRRAWDMARVREVMESIKEDRILHLAVHLAYTILYGTLE